jgi:hypothetical protein
MIEPEFLAVTTSRRNLQFYRRLLAGQKELSPAGLGPFFHVRLIRFVLNGCHHSPVNGCKRFGRLAVTNAEDHEGIRLAEMRPLLREARRNETSSIREPS